jgi:hypothetical protein
MKIIHLSLINNHLPRAVFLEATNIDVNFLASFNSGSIFSNSKSFSSVVNANQKALSSASSITILILAIKLGFDSLNKAGLRKLLI